MSAKKKTKAKAIVCKVCKGDKEIRQKKKCCSSKMTSPDKGSWNL